jgi:hypothetical protein
MAGKKGVNPFAKKGKEDKSKQEEMKKGKKAPAGGKKSGKC